MSSLPKKLKLNNGLEVPIIGLGTSGMKNVEEVVYESIKDGVRLIDTASLYKTEEGVGKGIKRAIDEGIVKREDLFIVTKFWISEKEDPKKALINSLNKLQLKYVDLYLDHWPSTKCYKEKEEFKFVGIKDLWPKMEKLVEEGLTKSIGISNYNVQNISIVLSICKIKPVVNEVEFHPYLYQKDLKEMCDKENIKIFAYYPLIKGIITKNKFEKIMNEKKLDLLNEEIVLNLAKKYNKTPGQIILNWHLNIGVIPIPGTSNPKRMKENLGSCDFNLNNDEINSLCSFEDKQFRFCDSTRFIGIDIFA